MIVTRDMSGDQTQLYVGRQPGAPPGDDDDEEETKPVVFAKFVPTVTNTEDDPVVIEDSDDERLSETQSEVDDTFGEPDPVLTCKHSVQQIVAIFEGRAGIGLMDVLNNNSVAQIHAAMQSSNIPSNIPRNNGGHYGTPAVVQSAVVQPAVVQPAVVQPAVVQPAVVQPKFAAKPPLPRSNPAPNAPIFKSDEEAADRQANMCLGLPGNPMINGTRCLFSQQLGKGGYLPSWSPEHGFGTKGDPRRCLGCVRADQSSCNMPPLLQVSQASFDPEYVLGAPSAVSAAPAAAAHVQNVRPAGGNTESKKPSQADSHADEASSSKIGNWQRKADEAAAKAAASALEKQQRALANSARKELLSHNAAIHALASTAKATADALAIQQQKDESDRAKEKQDAAAALAFQHTANEMIMRKMQEDNDNLRRQIGLLSALDTEGRQRVAPSGAAASGASGKQPVVAAASGASGKQPVVEEEDEEDEEDVRPLRPIRRKQKRPGKAAASGKAPASQVGGGIANDDEEEPLDDEYVDDEAEEDNDGDVSSSRPKPRRRISYIGTQGTPTRVPTDISSRELLATALVEANISRARTFCTNPSCHLTALETQGFKQKRRCMRGLQAKRKATRRRRLLQQYWCLRKWIIFSQSAQRQSERTAFRSADRQKLIFLTIWLLIGT
jgi:hypothetical protein